MLYHFCEARVSILFMLFVLYPMTWQFDVISVVLCAFAILLEVQIMGAI